MTTRHYMAYPIAVIIPLIVVAIVLAKTYDWSNGALGTVLLCLIVLAALVGSLIAPKPLP